VAAEQTHFDLIVIGSGSAASSCWYAARQRSKSVAVFESDTLGGECPTHACVPTKALLHCADVLDTLRGAQRFGIKAGTVDFDYGTVRAWKDEVVSQTGAALGEKPYLDMGVKLIRERASFQAPGAVKAGGRTYTAERFLIATGSSQSIPDLPGLAEAGFITFREAIDLEEPPRRLLILGGGPVGCEFTHLFSAFGSQVTIVDHNPRLLSDEDPEVGELMGSIFAQRGISLLTGYEAQEVGREGAAKRVRLQRERGSETIVVDEILVATGKVPNLDLGLEAAGIEYDEGGVKVDDFLRTSNRLVYAAGDVAGPYRYTHSASYQGQVACYNMFEADKLRVDYGAMPRSVFSQPEVAAVGLTEAEARQRGLEPRVGFAEAADSDRALVTGSQWGFVKVLADSEGRLIGGALIGPRAGEVAQELALAVALGATAAQVAATIHAFPTFSETLAAACAAVVD
jgi:dihydrolipoamide dehydrogenase